MSIFCHRLHYYSGDNVVQWQVCDADLTRCALRNAAPLHLHSLNTEQQQDPLLPLIITAALDQLQ